MEFVLVLGSSDRGTRNKRVERAIDHFHLRRESPVMFIFSGKGGSPNSEASEMVEYAKTIDADFPWMMEDKSMSTIENFTRTRDLLVDHGWFSATYIRDYTFTICTSTFHAERALIIGEKILGPYGSVAIIHTDEPYDPSRREKELNALAAFMAMT